MEYRIWNVIETYDAFIVLLALRANLITLSRRSFAVFLQMLRVFLYYCLERDDLQRMPDGSRGNRLFLLFGYYATSFPSDWIFYA
jgi:hypothetical protein